MIKAGFESEGKGTVQEGNETWRRPVGLGRGSEWLGLHAELLQSCLTSRLFVTQWIIAHQAPLSMRIL